MTLFENMETIWKRTPSSKDVNSIVNIITWNIWQMDGLTGTIPFKKAQESYQQLDLFALMGFEEEKREEDPQPLCRIYDWRGNKSLTFVSLKEDRV